MYSTLCLGLTSPCGWSSQDSSVDLYTLTLRTYARALAGHTAEARVGLAELKERAERAEGMMYWKNSGTCTGVKAEKVLSG